MRPKQNPRCAYKVIEDMCLIVDVDSLIYHTLNDAGSMIWKLCDGKHSIPEIVSYVQNKFDVERKVVSGDVMKFINDLEKKHLLSL